LIVKPCINPDNLHISIFLDKTNIIAKLTLSLQKPESFRAKASEGEVVVFYLVGA